MLRLRRGEPPKLASFAFLDQVSASKSAARALNTAMRLPPHLTRATSPAEKNLLGIRRAPLWITLTPVRTTT
jgi:hypothetical protein